MSVRFKALENKTSVDPDEISEERYHYQAFIHSQNPLRPVQTKPTLLDATCWSRLNTMLDDVG
jgi:hypothetical protein